LTLTDEYTPPLWSAARLGESTQIPPLVVDGRLSADEIRAAAPLATGLVVLRTLCIEGDAMPSATLAEAFLDAGARVVLLARWGSLGDPADTDRLLRDVYAAFLAGRPIDEALRSARRTYVEAGGRAAAAASWAVFVAP
jgi:hypothetical protein